MTCSADFGAAVTSGVRADPREQVAQELLPGVGQLLSGGIQGVVGFMFCDTFDGLVADAADDVADDFGMGSRPPWMWSRPPWMRSRPPSTPRKSNPVHSRTRGRASERH